MKSICTSMLPICWAGVEISYSDRIFDRGCLSKEVNVHGTNFDHSDDLVDESSQDESQKVTSIEPVERADRRSIVCPWSDEEPKLPGPGEATDDDTIKQPNFGTEENSTAEKGLLHGLQLASAGALASIAGSVICDTGKASIRSLLVTSCHNGEGKTTAAINMAYGIVHEAGKNVILVDANPDSAILHQQFGVSPGVGLTDLLQARCSIRDVMHPTELDGLWFVSMGTPLKGRLEVLSNRNLPIVIERLAQSFDLVIIDGPSVYGATNPAVMASYVAGLVLVAECERTRWAVLKSAKDGLELAGVNILSVVTGSPR